MSKSSAPLARDSHQVTGKPPDRDAGRGPEGRCALSFGDVEALSFLLRVGPYGSIRIPSAHAAKLVALGLVRDLDRAYAAPPRCMRFYALTTKGTDARARLMVLLEELASPAHDPGSGAAERDPGVSG